MQSYNLFYNQSVLSIRKYNPFTKTEAGSENQFVFDAALNVELLLSGFLSDKTITICILYKEQQEETILLEKIKQFFCLQRAAGGIVLQKRRIVSIYRLGCWDFPKGHVEKGETDSEAAMREVTEETGLDLLSISNDLGYTYHIYPLGNQFVLKETHWYEMQTTSDKALIPQTEEFITDIQWIPLQNLHKITDNTYPSLIDLIVRWAKNM
jgi:8-oxo-dGTP pyrophosphatase MutT (NUDIX family)